MIRSILELPSEDKAEAFISMQMGKTLSIKGDEDRVFDELPIKLVIFDQKYCLFTLEDPIKSRTSLTVIATEHEAMAKSFKFLFESFWEKSRDYFYVNGQRHNLSEYKIGNGKFSTNMEYDFVI